MYDKLIKRVMNLLLNGEHEILRILKCQYEHSEIIDIEETGVGLYVDFKVSHEAIPLNDTVKQDFVFGDVNGIVDGINGAVGFILFISNGYIATLEGYSNVPGSWKSVNDEIPLVYINKKRDLKSIDVSTTVI